MSLLSLAVALFGMLFRYGFSVVSDPFPFLGVKVLVVEFLGSFWGHPDR